MTPEQLTNLSPEDRLQLYASLILELLHEGQLSIGAGDAAE